MSTTSRELGNRVQEGLTILRDTDDDDEGWALPSLATIASSFNALGCLVQRGEDAHRYRIALKRIVDEWTPESGYSEEDIRQFVRSVLDGGTARCRIGVLGEPPA